MTRDYDTEKTKLDQRHEIYIKNKNKTKNTIFILHRAFI